MLGRFGSCCFLLILTRGIDSPLLKTDTPILWPVKRGTNAISCPILQEALQLQAAIHLVAWYKCVAKFQTAKDCPDWPWVAGFNSTFHVQVNNDSKHNLDQRGILQVRDVTEADNGTMYRCTVRSCSGCDPESIYINLLFDVFLFDQEEVIPTKPKATSEDVTGSSSIPTEKTTTTSGETKGTVGTDPTCPSSRGAQLTVSRDNTNVILTYLFAVLSAVFGGCYFNMHRKWNELPYPNLKNQGELAEGPRDITMAWR